MIYRKTHVNYVNDARIVEMHPQLFFIHLFHTSRIRVLKQSHRGLIEQRLLIDYSAQIASHESTLATKFYYSPGGIDEVYYKRCYTENEN